MSTRSRFRRHRAPIRLLSSPSAAHPTTSVISLSTTAAHQSGVSFDDRTRDLLPSNGIEPKPQIWPNNLNRYLAALATSTAIALATSQAVHAETMLVVPGTKSSLFGVIQLDGVPIPGYPASVGSGFHPDADVSVIDYPASSWPLSGLNTPTVGDSVETGADNLDIAIKAADGPIVVTGASQGAMVINREQERLANDPDAPPPDQLKFIVFSDPQRGLFSTVRDGTYIPIVDFQTRAPVESQYDTIVVIAEYDGWADFPDRPWNFISVANAVMGAATVHGIVALIDPATVPPENVTVTTNSKGAATTTYLVPTEHLPLTQPLRNLGVHEGIVDTVDKFLRPIVDAGYSRNDDPAHPPRPYVSHGEFRINNPAPAIESAAAAPDPEGLANDETQEPKRDSSEPEPDPEQRTNVTRDEERRAEQQPTRQQEREDHDDQQSANQEDADQDDQ